MTQATTTIQDDVEEDGSQKDSTILKVTAILLFILNLAVSVVIMLLPFQDLLRGKFQRHPQKVLVILFAFSLTLAILLYTLGATKRSSRKYSTLGGTTYLALGLLCAVEIFILAANRTADVQAIATSLWWLFAVVTVLGAVGVYLPVRARRLKEAERERAAKEARLRERRKSPIVFRLKVRRYYIYENKLCVYTD